MAYTFYKGIVESIIDETPVVKRYFIKMPELEVFDFIAGQFVMLDLPIASKVTTRAYSISSAPANNNLIELVIVLKPDGLGTPHLFTNVKEGDTLMVSQPLGKFIRPRPERFEQDLCFICTGTGIAPFRSMIQDIFNYNIPHKNIYLIKGCRRPGDILYAEEMKVLSENKPSFNFIPVLSRATQEEWEGHHGYVHTVYQRMFPEPGNMLFYICGWKEMIMQARKNLMEMGVDKNNIRFELYD